MELRPHHGLCLLFFQGKGYSPEFVKNMTQLKQALAENRLVQLTGQPDNICSACPHFVDGDCGAKAPRYDQAILDLCRLHLGQTLSLGQLQEAIRANILTPGLREQVCGDCQWSDLCQEEVL